MALPIPILINGREYTWSDISVSIMGSPMWSITEINYSQKRNAENLYGAGSQPIARGTGNVEYTASITLKMSEVENLLTVAPDNDLTAIPPFDIVIAFIDAGLVARRHTLKNCVFLNDDRSAKQGDTSLDVKLDLLPSNIIRK